eukprot:scaffold15251_cov214-Alexandrium_tamarense.AAC.6
MPHGRSWSVINRPAFVATVLPKYFGHDNYCSFIRAVNGWGFRRVTTGDEKDSYYHELFLRGRRDLYERMKRVPANYRKSALGKEDRAPDFWELSKVSPLPEADVIGEGSFVIMINKAAKKKRATKKEQQVVAVASVAPFASPSDDVNLTSSPVSKEGNININTAPSQVKQSFASLSLPITNVPTTSTDNKTTFMATQETNRGNEALVEQIMQGGQQQASLPQAQLQRGQSVGLPSLQALSGASTSSLEALVAALTRVQGQGSGGINGISNHGAGTSNVEALIASLARGQGSSGINSAFNSNGGASCSNLGALAASLAQQDRGSTSTIYAGALNSTLNLLQTATAPVSSSSLRARSLGNLPPELLSRLLLSNFSTFAQQHPPLPLQTSLQSALYQQRPTAQISSQFGINSNSTATVSSELELLLRLRNIQGMMQQSSTVNSQNVGSEELLLLQTLFRR